jgi:hypothetical protein
MKSNKKLIIGAVIVIIFLTICCLVSAVAYYMYDNNSIFGNGCLYDDGNGFIELDNGETYETDSTIVYCNRGVLEFEDSDISEFVEEDVVSDENCEPDFNFTMPVDINKVTGLLYPGQFRGPDFKAHGGFRFDNSEGDEITVTAPFDATVESGSRYLESGEVQYWFDFISDCGVVYRFDHLVDLNEKLTEAVKVLPEAVAGDSRSWELAEPVEIEKGEVIATSVGIIEGDNIFVDFGLYNYNELNESAQDQEFYEAQKDDETDIHGLCWLDYLPKADSDYLRTLPTGQEGIQSEFCD